MARLQIRHRRSFVTVGLLIGLVILFRYQLIVVLDRVSGFVLARVTGIEQVVETLASIRTLETDNHRLEAENIRLRSEIIEAQGYKGENEALRSELQLLTERNWRDRSVTGLVIGRSPSQFLQTIRIDLGLVDGIMEGAPVTSQGFFIGRIQETGPTSSLVELVTSSRSRIPVALPELQADGLLQGGLSGLMVEEILTGVEVKIGAAVVTTNLGEVVPAGLPIGTVAQELPSDTKLSKSILVQSPINFYDLTVVSVVTIQTES